MGNAGTVCRDHCIRNGLMLRATRDTMLISPSLTWTKGHIQAFITIVKKGLDLTLERFEELVTKKPSNI